MKSWRTMYETRRRFGAVAVGRRLMDCALHRAVELNPAHLLWIPTAEVQPQATVDAYGDFSFLSPGEVAALLDEPSLGLNPAFVSRAQRGHDLCYALRADRQTLHYGWFALESIDPEFFAGTSMSFPAHMVYVYNVFTPVEHRGHGLNRVCLSAVLTALQERGVKGCLAAIHWTNEASLRSFRRLGAHDLGMLATARIAGRRVERTPAAAERLGVRFGAEAYLGQRRFPRPANQRRCALA